MRSCSSLIERGEEDYDYNTKMLLIWNLRSAFSGNCLSLKSLAQHVSPARAPRSASANTVAVASTGFNGRPSLPHRTPCLYGNFWKVPSRLCSGLRSHLNSRFCCWHGGRAAWAKAEADEPANRASASRNAVRYPVNHGSPASRRILLLPL